MQEFAKTLTDQSTAIKALKSKSGLSEAAGALPGTDWESACHGTGTSIDNAVERIGSRFDTISDAVVHAGKVLVDTDQALKDDLEKVGLQFGAPGPAPAPAGVPV
ncbi:MAG: hypothetical protein J2P18_18910 [Nocardia sp.]|nr:hypothetical protein [Nocardia sp.]